MFRKMLAKKTWLLITVALAVTCWCLPASAYQLQVKAWIDGYSQLIIQGNTVQWHNTYWTVPGMEPEEENGPNPNFPTYLTTVDMGEVQWQPTWTPGGDPPVGPQDSNIFTGLNRPLAAFEQTVGLVKLEGRLNVFISQQPAGGNNYTLIVDFDDINEGGAAWYTACLTYEPGPPSAPLPGTAILLGSGLVGLLGWRRSRQG